MSRSTKLVSAANILAFVAAQGGEQVTTDAIARAVGDHPARVRQLVAALVKGELLASVRGAGGGVVLSRAPRQINLRQIHEAVGESPVLGLGTRDGDGAWGPQSRVEETFTTLYRAIEDDILRRLGSVTLDRLIAD